MYATSLHDLNPGASIMMAHSGNNILEFSEISSSDMLYSSINNVMSTIQPRESTDCEDVLLNPSYNKNCMSYSSSLSSTDFLTTSPPDSSQSPNSDKFNFDQLYRQNPDSFLSELSSPEVTSATSDLENPKHSPEQRLSSLKYPPCLVCSGKASGLHYGCYTCEACKNFYRRYLIRNEGFNCKKQQNCQIINRSRGNCSGCRLKKCLAVGMSKEKSKIGRYTHAQRTETIREVNKLEGKQFDDEVDTIKVIKTEVDTSENISNSSTDDAREQLEFMDVNLGSKACKPKTEGFESELTGILLESMNAIEHFGKQGATPEGRLEIIERHYDRYLAKVKLFGPLKAIPKEEYFTLLKLYDIDLDGRWSLFKQEANNCGHIVERYVAFSRKIPGFQQINQKDQECLLKYGHCDFFIILLHKGYEDKYKIFLEMNGVPSHVEEAADKIFSREAIEMQCELQLRWQKLQLTDEEMALLLAMSLVCTDRCELVEPDIVNEIHSKLVDLLMDYLKHHYGSGGPKRFSKFIDVLMFSRKGSELYFKEYKEMSNNEMVNEVAPAFPTLCPD